MLKSKRIVSFAYLLAFATVWVAMGCSKHGHPAAEQPQPPLVNRLAFSIDGGPEITYQGSSTFSQGDASGLATFIGPWTGDQTSNAEPTGVFLTASTPDVAQGHSYLIQIGANKLEDGKSPLIDEFDFIRLIQFGPNATFTNRSFYTLAFNTPQAPKNHFSAHLDPLSGYYHGDFDITFCEQDAVFASTCGLTENQLHFVGHFDIKDTTTKAPPAPPTGTSEHPVDLGSAPYVANQQARGLMMHKDQTPGFYSIKVEAGKKYVIDAFTSLDVNGLTDSVPFRVFTDASFSQELCASTQSTWFNQCVATSPSDHLYVRVDPPSIENDTFFNFSIFRDITDYPIVDSSKTASPVNLPIIDNVHAWMMVYTINVKPGSSYSANLISPHNENFSVGVLDVYDGPIGLYDYYQDCGSGGLDQEGRYVFNYKTYYPKLCNSTAAKNSCEFQATQSVVSVVFRSHTWAGDLPYRIEFAPTAGHVNYVDQGTFNQPVLLGETPIVKFLGQVGVGTSYYQATVTPGSIYRFELVNADISKFSDFYLEYDEPKGLTNQISRCPRTSGCYIEPQSDTIILFARANTSYGLSGGAFYLSVHLVEGALTSETKSLTAAALPYAGQTGPRGSNYTLNIEPGAKYHVTTTQPEGGFDEISFSIHNALAPNEGVCKSTYRVFKTQECVFVANSSLSQIQIDIHDDQGGVVPGSRFTLNVVKDDNLDVPSSEGIDTPQELVVGQPYRGQVGYLTSHYTVTVVPGHRYHFTVHEITAGISLPYSFVTQPSRFYYPRYLFLLVPQCTFQMDANQDRFDFSIVSRGSQGAQYTILVAEKN